MKIKPLLLLFVIILASCKEKTAEPINYPEAVLDVTTSIYPDHISAIFKAHGGIARWNAMQSLVFTMADEEGDEVTTTNLKSRESLITMRDHAIGFDGKDVWIHKKDTTSYKGNPRFYYNLMFYFYAMPFILADDGINYEDVEPLQFEGKEYPGINISYETGVGESPDDEYVIYYNKETYQMAWLAYTVTYFSKEKSKDFHLIKYNEWQRTDDLLLPKGLQWFNYENGVIGEKTSDVQFTEIQLSTKPMEKQVFEKPEGASIVE